MFRPSASVLSTALLSAALAACASQGPRTAEEVAGDPGAPDQVWAEQAVLTKEGRLCSSSSFPTGHVETSVLLLERDLPAEIVDGQEFWYELKVTNVDHMPVTDVMLRDDCASDWEMVRAEPAPVTKDSPLTWALGVLNPGETRTVHVTGKTMGTKAFTSCASATFSSVLCLTAPVVSPALRVTLHAPAEVTPCDDIDVRLSVVNAGTGMARDVRVAYPLPEGWMTADGKKSAQFSVDSLDAGESREFELVAKAQRVGEFTSRATATAAPALKTESTSVTTAVRQAVLVVEAEATEHVHAGQPATFTFKVTNTGTAPATMATVESRVPAGTKFLSATEGGTFDDGLVVWKLSTLPVDGSRTLSMTLESGPTVTGSIEGIASAKAYCAVTAENEARVAILSLPALLLEVTDLTDPVEVGRDTVYEIVITNQGTATATNVRIAATLEDTEQYVSATGAKAMVSGGSVTFEPIASIAPKAKATLRLTVKCVDEGDTRFRISMTADQITRPVEETESTHIYR